MAVGHCWGSSPCTKRNMSLDRKSQAGRRALGWWDCNQPHKKWVSCSGRRFLQQVTLLSDWARTGSARPSYVAEHKGKVEPYTGAKPIFLALERCTCEASWSRIRATQLRKVNVKPAVNASSISCSFTDVRHKTSFLCSAKVKPFEWKLQICCLECSACSSPRTALFMCTKWEATPQFLPVFSSCLWGVEIPVEFCKLSVVYFESTWSKHKQLGINHRERPQAVQTLFSFVWPGFTAGMFFLITRVISISEMVCPCCGKSQHNTCKHSNMHHCLAAKGLEPIHFAEEIGDEKISLPQKLHHKTRYVGCKPPSGFHVFVTELNFAIPITSLIFLAVMQ